MRFNLSSVAVGDPLLAEVKAGDGRVWDVPIVSVGGAPAMLHLIGGDTANLDPPPATALAAIHSELQSLFEDGQPHERLPLAAVGFIDRVRRPSQPGRPPDSDENLAVRARRTLNTPGKATRVGATEADAFERARARGIHKAGRLTAFGEELLEEVDRVKTAVLEALQEEQHLALDDLVARLHGYPESALRASVYDLDLDQKVEVAVEPCASCGSAHRSIRLRS